MYINPKIINQVSQSLRYSRPHPVSNHLTTDNTGMIHLESVSKVMRLGPICGRGA